MPADRCRTCGRLLPPRAGRRGRTSVYCSPACRQRAYRSRRGPPPGELVQDLITGIERRVRGLAPHLPEAFYEDVADLSASVSDLRRVARIARDAARYGEARYTAAASDPPEASRIVTPVWVTESEVESGMRAGPRLGEDAAAVAAVRSGDEQEFAGLVEPHRRELRVHCYRMVGSYDESEDLVQETFLRAWRGRDGFQGRSTLRAWLYRIATNACLDFLRRNQRRPARYEAAMGPAGEEPPARVSWLQPYPDLLLADMASGEEEPDAAVVSRETMELVFLVAIQHLPPRQRAVLILRDVLGWSAGETAGLLETSSTASVNSALQRARSTVRQHLPERRTEWGRPVEPTAAEHAILQRYMELAVRGDVAAMAELLSEDVRLTMPPNPMWFIGRDAVLAFVGPVFDPASPQYFGRWRHLPTRANRQPAAAAYVQRPGTTVYRAQVLDVLRVGGGKIVEITSFEPHLLPAFGLPMTLSA